MVSIRSLLTTASCLLPFVTAEPFPDVHEHSKRQFERGTIRLPAAGTFVAPGESFRFEYNARNDYGLSSYNISVALLTSDPGSTPDTSFLAQMMGAAPPGYALGYWFGRFGIAYIQSPPVPNPPPRFLTMPDFSQSPWNSGPVTDLRVYLAVLEEWSGFTGTVGKRLSLTSNYLIYNSSIPGPPPPVCETLPRATGTCGCQFTHYCNITYNDGSSIYHGEERTELGCMNLCDSTAFCNSFLFVNSNCWLSTYLDGTEYDAEGFNTSVSDPVCKQACRDRGAVSKRKRSEEEVRLWD